MMLSPKCSFLIWNFLVILSTLSPSSASFIDRRKPLHLQEVFSRPSPVKTPPQPFLKKAHFSKYLDAAPNPIGLLLTTAGGKEEEVIHLWLPLGERVNTRVSDPIMYHLPGLPDLLMPLVGDSPFLPLHPLSARTTTMIADAPERASTEYFDAIKCKVYPAFNAVGQISDLSRKPPKEFAALSLSRADGLVHMADEFGVGEGEVEAYECS